MLYGLLVTLYSLVCLLLILIVMLQRGQGGFSWINGSGNSQMFFGASGGQDFTQKASWTLGTLLMIGSLGLSLYKANLAKQSKFIPAHSRVASPVKPAEELITPPIAADDAAADLLEDAPEVS
jgi:preprotein translocase subunit SecG